MRAIASDITGKESLPYEMDVVCIMDMGDTAVYMSAKPLLPPRQELRLKKARWARWMKIWFEKYFLLKMNGGHTNWP